MRSFKTFITFCALFTLTYCELPSYRHAPVSPARTAAVLESRSLADPCPSRFHRKSAISVFQLASSRMEHREPSRRFLLFSDAERERAADDSMREIRGSKA